MYTIDFEFYIHADGMEKRKAVLDAIAKASGLQFDERNDRGGFALLRDTCWYSYYEKLAEVSRAHPDAVIEARGRDEDNVNNWKARFRNGEQETVVERRSYPPFREILLPGEKSDPRDLTLDEIKVKNALATALSRQCREQFIRTVKSYIPAHPELPEGKIWLDPENTFGALRSTRHYDSYTGDVLSVGLDARGRLVFGHSSQYDYEKEVNLADETCYGLYIEDWPWALEVLLTHLEEPYIPDEYAAFCEDGGPAGE